MSDPPPPPLSSPATIVFPPGITRRLLFTTFLRIGMSGFGGVMPHARHVLVVQEKWLDERGFMELLSLGQLLPGPNIVNVSVMIGARLHGASGAFAAITGLILAPFFSVLVLAILYDRYGELPWLKSVVAFVSAAAAGLIVATGIRLARATPVRWWIPPIAIAAFVAVAIFHIPLAAVIIVLGSLGVLCAWRWPGAQA